MACTPQVYVEEGLWLARYIREGKVENTKESLDAYAEKSIKKKKKIKEATIKFAQKMLKYPDMRKAAYDKEYRESFK